MDSRRSFVEILKQSPARDEEATVEIDNKDCARVFRRLEQCMVGRWEGRDPIQCDLAEVGKEMCRKWGLKGFLGLAKWGDEKFLLEFESKGEALWVMQRGERNFRKFKVKLNLWEPEEGCCSEWIPKRELWVRLLGLPIQFWEPKVLERLGDACGGFIACDRSTKDMMNFQWARMLIRVKG